MMDVGIPESGGILGNITHTIGFDGGKVVKSKGILRKTVDYGACVVRMLEVSRIIHGFTYKRMHLDANLVFEPYCS